MNTIPHGFTLLSEKDLSTNDLIELTLPTYQQAFLKGVWQENLSNEEITRRLVKNFSSNFKGYWLLDEAGNLACASWYEFASIDFIKIEKSKELSVFAQNLVKDLDIRHIIWYTEIMTHPDYWHRGFAKLLTGFNLTNINIQSKVNSSNDLVLIRMRDDNKNVIAIIENLDMKRTGIRKPSSVDPTNPEKCHEFWYKIYP